MKKSSFKELMQFAGNHRYLTYLSLILSAASSFLALLPFYYIWKIIKDALQTAPDFSKAQNIGKNGWLAVFFALISIIIYILGLLCSHKSAFCVQANIRIRLTRHIMDLPIGIIGNLGSGKLRKTIDESGTETETYLAHQLPDRAGAAATPIGLLIMLLAFDWRLGLPSLLPVIAAFFIMAAMTGSKMAEKMKEYKNSLENMSNEAVEYVRGIPVVKTFRQTVFSFKRFKQSIDEYEKWVISYTKDLRLPMMFYTTAINGVFSVLIAAALFFTSNGITGDFILNLVFYIIITPIITVTLNKIMYSSENKMIVDDALDRINSILNMKPIEEAKKPQCPKNNGILLKDVKFRYKNDSPNAIDGISLKINPGEHVAFVGPSGGGKSTLAGIIAGFWRSNEGEIIIGGINSENIKSNDLMNTVSFVFQDSKLIKSSIYENIKMGNPKASRQEVFQAINDAQCGDIIEKPPDGADTVVGSKGVYLSGGEARRISIARAMLKNAPIIILDEATAFADPDNEIRVQQAFSKLSKGKTVIMIAHRLSTITSADKIIVIKDGKINSYGTHNELLSKKGIYYEMWKEYSKSAKWKVGDLNA